MHSQFWALVYWSGTLNLIVNYMLNRNFVKSLSTMKMTMASIDLISTAIF